MLHSISRLHYCPARLYRLVAFFLLALIGLAIGSGVVPTRAAAPQPQVIAEMRNIEFPAVLDGKLFFSGQERPLSGNHLWRSDGTAEGTALFKELGELSSFPSGLTTIGDVIYFVADDGIYGNELWKTDGTVAGTIMVKDINPGAEGGWPIGGYKNFTVAGDTIFFIADDGTHGEELWKTDGTTAGTVMVKDIMLGDGSPFVFGRELHVVNNTILFFADDGIHGKELWKSDGTTDGTMLVRDINPGTDAMLLNSSMIMNDTLFFNIDDGTHGEELWKSDGTSAGTSLVKDICPGECNGMGLPIAQMNGRLLLKASEKEHGTELWISDGSVGGTKLVKDIWPGSGHGKPGETLVINDTLFFTAEDGIHGEELWKSDGTAAGTIMLKDIHLGNMHDPPREFVAVGGELFFFANAKLPENDYGEELWKSDGTVAGTVVVKMWSGEVRPSDYLVVNDTLFFNDHGNGYWQTDGTKAGTVQVLENEVQSQVVIGNTLYFVSDYTSSIRSNTLYSIPVFPAPDPTLTRNYPDGQPGSTFLFTANKFRANTMHTLRINGIYVPVEPPLVTDETGAVNFKLSTEGLTPGRYVVTLSDIGEEAVLTQVVESAFVIDETAPLREREGPSAPVVSVPTTIDPLPLAVDDKRAYLPFIRR